MTSTIRTTGSALVVAAALAAAAPAALAQWGAARVDHWLVYQDNFGDTARWQYKPKIFLPYKFGSGWTFTQRIDVPMFVTDAPGPDNEGGGWKFGLSDLYLEEIVDTPELAGGLRLRASLRVVFPTGGQAPFGADQWQVAPGVGVHWRLPDAGRGVTFAPYARYFHGFDPRTSGIRTKRSWTLYPTATFGLDPKWSLVLWPEQGITYNRRSHKWFVPIEAMATYRISKPWEVSLGGAVPVNDDDRSYRWLVQGRLSRYFD